MGMNVWIVTIGNSDVQLKHNYEESNEWSNRSKNPEIRSKLRPHGVNDFKPSRPQNWSEGDPFTVPARVMGIVYGQNLDDEVFKDLHFPLLDKFTEYLQSTKRPDKIIVILTDQEKVFDNNNRNKKSPYWQDTCTLQPILEKYFEKKYPQLKTNEHICYLRLTPKAHEKGLDDWDYCLKLVDNRFEQEIVCLPETKKPANIFVSHQAGTPAISSAVQFTSLAKFEKQVKFLVSNEYSQEKALPIPSSNYLQGIKLQEAKELLGRYDYSGVEKILNELWENKEESLNFQEQKIKELLAIATKWNNANFDEFEKDIITINDNAKKRTQEWWWTGYEAGYLAVIRFEQDNYVEALFHSFRALEGLTIKWAEFKYKKHLYKDSKGTYYFKGSITTELKHFHKQDFHEKKRVGLYGKALYDLLKESHDELRQNPENFDISVWEDVADRRNNLFHNLLGLEKDEVFKAWNTNSKKKWQQRVLRCLNFITKQEFTSLQEASLMSSVHKELETAINNYELQAPS